MTCSEHFTAIPVSIPGITMTQINTSAPPYVNVFLKIPEGGTYRLELDVPYLSLFVYLCVCLLTGCFKMLMFNMFKMLSKLMRKYAVSINPLHFALSNDKTNSQLWMHFTLCCSPLDSRQCWGLGRKHPVPPAAGNHQISQIFYASRKGKACGNVLIFQFSNVVPILLEMYCTAM